MLQRDGEGEERQPRKYDALILTLRQHTHPHTHTIYKVYIYISLFLLEYSLPLTLLVLGVDTSSCRGQGTHAQVGPGQEIIVRWASAHDYTYTFAVVAATDQASDKPIHTCVYVWFARQHAGGVRCQPPIPNAGGTGHPTSVLSRVWSSIPTSLTTTPSSTPTTSQSTTLSS